MRKQPGATGVLVKGLGRMTLLRSTSKLTIFNHLTQKPQATMRRVDMKATHRDNYHQPGDYAQTAINGWWMEDLKDKAAGHQFVLTKRFNYSTPVYGTVCLRHRRSGLNLSQPSTNANDSQLHLYAALLGNSRKHEVSLEDYLLYRLLQRMQKLADEIPQCKSPASLKLLAEIGLDPARSIEDWMGAEAYERAEYVLVKIKLTTQDHE